MDGEDEILPATEVDAHLASCPHCQQWHQAATDLTRRLRVRSAVQAPDLVDAVLAAAPPPQPRGLSARILLAGVGMAQLGVGLGQLINPTAGTAHGHEGAQFAGHLFGESAAWNLALGVGMFWAALNARRASGLLPVLGGFLAVLIGLSVHDLITNAVPWSRVLSHGPLLVGLGLLYLVHRHHQCHGTPTPDRPTTLDEPGYPVPMTAAGDPLDAPPDTRHEGRRGGRPPLRPAGHRHVA